MSTLHDRLGALADEAGPGTPPDDLWSAGRRLQRRQRMGTAVVLVAALVAVAGLGGLGWSRSRVTVEPAGADTPLGMPSQIWAASEHLPGTDDTGPIGPLVAIVVAPRSGWLHGSRDAVLGISATGEYAYLDLPHGMDPVEWALGAPAISADGRFVAYWRAGTPEGEPGNAQMGDPTDPAVGVGVYDTVTGETYEHLVATEHGLQPENLVWAGHRVWFDVWQMDAPRGDGGQSAQRTEVLAWDPVADDIRTAPASVDIDNATAWGESLLTSHRDKLRKVTLEGTETVAELDSGVFDFGMPFFIAPGEERVAVERATGSDVPLLVGSLGARDDEVLLREVPSKSVGHGNALLGWRDPDHVVVIDYGAGTGEATYETVDVVTGDTKILGYAEGNQPILAADALAGPVFQAPEPPRPLNPFVGYGGIATTVLLAGLAVRWWRRRVQR